MAQTEDVELRDLVLESLEKNGSLAKIRALLRANVFMAFENECEKKNRNSVLERVLKMPEGKLALSLVHELLEFCNFKTTLFEYVSETHQGGDYDYIGSNKLADKLNIPQRDHEKEPILVSLLRKHYKISPRKIFDHGDGLTNGFHHQFKDEQNCTYIVHEDSSATSSSQSTSQSENSSDEKNRLQLRLPLDNSDTDTSSDSARDKTSSEYVPNDKIIIRDESEEDNKSNTSQQSHTSTGVDHNKYEENTGDQNQGNKKDNTMTFAEYQQMQLGANESSDSTSYVQLKPYNQHDKKMLNTTGLPLPDAPFFTDVTSKISESFPHIVNENKEAQESKSDPTSAGSLSNSTSIHSLNTDSKRKSDGKGTPEYSYDFSTSPNSKQKENKANLSHTSVADTLGKNMPIDSPRQDSHSARSSISISDVADLVELSESNSPRVNEESGQKRSLILNKRKNETDIKLPSDDSGDSSGSPIPSLSNLSLDLHSD